MKLLLITVLAFVITCCKTKPEVEESLKTEIAIEAVEDNQEEVEDNQEEVEDDREEVKDDMESMVSVKRVSELPDFAQYTDVKQKKQAFFDFLRPMIVAENERIDMQRARIKTIFSTYNDTGVLSEEDSSWIVDVAKGMRMERFVIANKEDRQVLLRKKDIVPVSMFLAQAANESSWGTSRFAREANNLFGQWCYTPGCGIVPSQRKAGDVNEVRKFATINDAVKSYVRNINSYYAYKDLRMVREEIRNTGNVPDGHSLARGLLNYSQRGEEYVKEIQAIIRVNKLDEIQ